MDYLQLVPENTFLLGYAGSHAHGTYIPKNDPNSIDDIDLLGVCYGPLREFLRLKNLEQKIVKEGEWDITVYGIKKFFTLLEKGNPNVMALLWLDSTDYLIKDILGIEIIRNRDIFSSAESYHAYRGYCKQQIYKMTKPAFEGDMGQKRKALFNQFGYDTKNAAHAIRIIRQGIEFLTTGVLLVKRHDAEELIAIKQGKWTIEQVLDEYNGLEKELDKAFKTTSLPYQPNFTEIDALLEYCVVEFLNKRI